MNRWNERRFKIILPQNFTKVITIKNWYGSLAINFKWFLLLKFLKERIIYTNGFEVMPILAPLWACIWIRWNLGSGFVQEFTKWFSCLLCGSFLRKSLTKQVLRSLLRCIYYFIFLISTGRKITFTTLDDWIWHRNGEKFYIRSTL